MNICAGIPRAARVMPESNDDVAVSRGCMRRSVFPFLLLVAGLLTAGCGGGSPSSPSDIDARPRGTIVDVMCPEFGERSRCTAFATTGGIDVQDVTGLATWSTSDSTIATVKSTGVVTVRRAGEVSIRAAYQGGTGFRQVWAVPGEGLHEPLAPWRVLYSASTVLFRAS